MEQKLLIYNTLTRTKERFTPLHAPTWACMFVALPCMAIRISVMHDQPSHSIYSSAISSTWAIRFATLETLPTWATWSTMQMKAMTRLRRRLAWSSWSQWRLRSTTSTATTMPWRR